MLTPHDQTTEELAPRCNRTKSPCNRCLQSSWRLACFPADQALLSCWLELLASQPHAHLATEAAPFYRLSAQTFALAFSGKDAAAMVLISRTSGIILNHFTFSSRLAREACGVGHHSKAFTLAWSE